MKYVRTVSWTWTNWTFGYWYHKKLRARGVDLGPLEIIWKHPRETSLNRPGSDTVHRHPDGSWRGSPAPMRMMGRKPALRSPESPFRYDSGPVQRDSGPARRGGLNPRVDARNRRKELERLRDDQQRLRGDSL